VVRDPEAPDTRDTNMKKLIGPILWLALLLLQTLPAAAGGKIATNHNETLFS
jgi:hypothetical protein